jgi:hypothetical protein
MDNWNNSFSADLTYSLHQSDYQSDLSRFD